MLVPTCLHFSTKNPPTSHKKSISRGIENLIDFRPHFPLILAPFWDSSWAYVGHFFATRRPKDPPKKYHKLIQTPKTAQNTSQTLWTSIVAPPDLHFGAPRPPSICSTLPLPPPARGSGLAQSVRWAPLSPPTYCFCQRKTKFFQNKACRCRHRCWIDCGVNLAPFFHQKSTRIK